MKDTRDLWAVTERSGCSGHRHQEQPHPGLLSFLPPFPLGGGSTVCISTAGVSRHWRGDAAACFRRLQCVHLCLWADGGREVLHHDGAAGTGAAGHCASGTCWDLTGQPGEEHLQLPQGKKDRVEGLELFVIGNIMEYKAWLYPDTQGPSEREALHPPGQQGSMRRAKALVLEEQWLYSSLLFYFVL